MKRRILSIVLVLCMLLSIVPLTPVTTAAEGTSGVSVTVCEGTAGKTGGTEDAFYAFDGDTDTKWCVQSFANKSAYVVVEPTESMALACYTFTTGADTASYSGRNPKSWTVYGSNDRKTWTQVDKVTDGAMPTDNKASKSFTVSGCGKYSYYKFQIDSIVGTSDAELFQLSEISLVAAVEPDYSWYTSNTKASEFTISTAGQLLGFANLVNGTDLPADVGGQVGFGGKTVKLANDIDLSPIANWTPISKSDVNQFKGIFDGNNKTVSNLTVNYDGHYAGLFGYTNDATIKKLAVSGNVTGTEDYSDVGGVVGCLNGGSIENCSFSGNVTGNGNYAGGIVGNANYGAISKCSNYAAVSGTAFYIGGIVGGASADVRYCYNQGTVTAGSNYAYCGGIVGSFNRPSGSATVTSCYSIGSISVTWGYADVGEIIGYISTREATGTIDNSYFPEGGANGGIGKIYTGEYGTVIDNTSARSSAAFSSGEVAWLLQNAAADADGQVWGQTLGTDAYPVFANENGSNKVYKLTFQVDGEPDQVKYVNGGTLSTYCPAEPSRDGCTFLGWYSGGKWLSTDITVAEDLTLKAEFLQTPVSLDGVAVTVNKLTYNGKAQAPTAADVTVTVNGIELPDGYYTVTATAQTDAGTYELTITGDGESCTGSTTAPWTISKGTLSLKRDTVYIRTAGTGTAVLDIRQLLGDVSDPICAIEPYYQALIAKDDKVFAEIDGTVLTVKSNWNNQYKSLDWHFYFTIDVKNYEQARVCVEVRAMHTNYSKTDKALTLTMNDWTYGETESEPKYDIQVEYDYMSYFNLKHTYYRDGEATPLSGKPSDAGKYKVVVSYEDEYNIYTGEAAFEIRQATSSFEIDNINENLLTLVYGTPHTLTLTGGSTYGKLEYTVTRGSEALSVDRDTGVVTPKQQGIAMITVRETSPNYTECSCEILVLVNERNVTLTVMEKTAYVGDAAPDLSSPVVGEDYTVSGLVDGDTLSFDLRYNSTPDMTKPGKYRIIAYDNDAHYAVKSNSASLSVVARITFDPNGGTVAVTGATTDTDGKLTLADLPVPTRDYGFTFNGWFTEKTGGTEVKTDTVFTTNTTVYAHWSDDIAPTGEIKLGNNGWKTFLNNITFGLFFKDTQEVTITAADNSGEDVEIEYLLSDKELTAEELETATFTAYSNRFSVESNNEYVIYAKLSDKTGNVAYINSNGIALDNIAPIISGITNGENYCEAQTVTVIDKYVDTVTVNGTSVTLDANGQFTISPAEGTQIIVAKDQAGNVSAEMLVTVNDGHTYEWQNENGQYWQKCKFCGNETAKKDIPEITINGADKVCKTQDYKFSFTVPEGLCDVTYGYEFENKSDGGIQPKFENGIYSDTIPFNVLKDDTSFTLVVEATTADGYLISVRKDVQILQEHTGGTATCTEKAECEVCDEEYGEADATNHTTLKHIEAKAATTEVKGNIEYWHCVACNKYFSDKACKDEITLADTVIAKLTKTVSDNKSPQTGYNSHIALWFALLFVSGGTLVGTSIYGKKKKYFANLLKNQ